MTVRTIIGDCRTVLPTLSTGSVHCVVTSPPYWGLRDYGIGGQIGLEPTYQAYIAGIVAVFREVRRVLEDRGTCWVNLGDSYATQVNGRSAHDTKLKGNDSRTFRDKPFSTIQGNLKPKDLCGIPWRVAFALQDDGWWLRQDIIWSKPNPMPESITDRCTKAHEYLFLLAKSVKYYFDAAGIAEPLAAEPKQSGGFRPEKATGPMARNGHSQWERRRTLKDSYPNLSRNKRSVWEIATAPFNEAHFATFPPALIEPCILAGCPKGGTVLDPFGGAGTTGLVADRLQRNAILIELNPNYAEMSRRRIVNDAPLFGAITC